MHVFRRRGGRMSGWRRALSLSPSPSSLSYFSTTPSTWGEANTNSVENDFDSNNNNNNNNNNINKKNGDDDGVSRPGVSFDSFGEIQVATAKKRPDGRPKLRRETVERVTLTNRRGTQAVLSSFGASLLSLSVPDRTGKRENVLKTFSSPHEAQKNATGRGGAGALVTQPLYGAVLGPVAGRISGGIFQLDSKSPVHIYSNDGRGNVVHGGMEAFSGRNWELEPNSLKRAYLPFAKESCRERDAGEDEGGEMGEEKEEEDETSHDAPCEITFMHETEQHNPWPGVLRVYVTYALSDYDELVVTMKALNLGHRPTPLNLTCNPYFNLAGTDDADDNNNNDDDDNSNNSNNNSNKIINNVDDHRLKIFAEAVLPTASSGDGTTTGEVVSLFSEGNDHNNANNSDSDGTNSSSSSSSSSSTVNVELHRWGGEEGKDNDEKGDGNVVDDENNSAVSVGPRRQALAKEQPHWPVGDCYLLDHHREVLSPALAATPREELTYFAAELSEPSSGRRVRLLTSEPCLQLHFAPGGEGIALRAQNFPDCLPGPTSTDTSDLEEEQRGEKEEGDGQGEQEQDLRAEFVNSYSKQCILEPGKTYVHRSVYAFDTF